jgi:hypothetical protein
MEAGLHAVKEHIAVSTENTSNRRTENINLSDASNLSPAPRSQAGKKGGRPRKYRTATAQKKGHAERQRRYRERKLVVVADVTKTPS